MRTHPVPGTLAGTGRAQSDTNPTLGRDGLVGRTDKKQHRKHKNRTSEAQSKEGDGEGRRWGKRDGGTAVRGGVRSV